MILSEEGCLRFGVIFHSGKHSNLQCQLKSLQAVLLEYLVSNISTSYLLTAILKTLENKIIVNIHFITTKPDTA
jgi:hypothetical protein